MLEGHERRRSIVSKESSLSAATSSQSVLGSLGTTGDARRPSSATSYSVGSTSGGKLRHASIASFGASNTGVNSSGDYTSGGVAPKNHQGSQGSGGIPSLSTLGIAEEEQISSQNEPSAQHLQLTVPDRGRNGSLQSPPFSNPVKLIHPGMEIFNYETGKPIATERQHATPPQNSTPFASPRLTGSRVISSFNPTHGFFITRMGTPGLSVGKSHKTHLLKKKGWEIRDASSAIRRGSDISSNFQKAGDVILGKNATAELALSSVVQEVFGSWGRWTDTVSHSPWRRSLDTTALSATPSTSSFFSHFRAPAPHSPTLTPTSPHLCPSFDARAGNLPGPLHGPPDPTYVSLKPSPASSKSTFYSIETSLFASGSSNISQPPGSYAEAYPSETGRIPISQWKVPYSVNSMSTITLLNNDSHQKQQQGYKFRPQKSTKVDVWAEVRNLRTQFFEMDRSTYTWEFRTRPKVRIPLAGYHGLFASPSFAGYSGPQSPRIPFHSTIMSPSGISSLPTTPTVPYYTIGLGGQRVVKFRSEILVLEKEVDGFRYIVGEYHFLKNLKSMTVSPAPANSRLKRFMSSPVSPGTPTSSQPQEPGSFKAKETVQYTNLGKHQSGILLLDSRGVNNVIALNSLLIVLKRERQRKLVTLNSSSNRVRGKRWGYGIHDATYGEVHSGQQRPGEEGDEEEEEEEGAYEEMGPAVLHPPRPTADNVPRLSISPHDLRIEGELVGNGDGGDEITEVDDYNLQGPDWEWHEEEWIKGRA